MKGNYLVSDIKMALLQQEHPTVMLWNRLEGRPRTDDFDRALKAEVRDALWMLTKQWQMGEFQGEDAASPVFAKIHMHTSQVTKYRPGQSGAVEAFQATVPLEARVEQIAIRWQWDNKKMRFDLRAQLGRQWRKMLVDAGMGAYVQQYLSLYPFVLPAQDAESDYIYAHREAWQQYAALAGRCIDGGDLYLHLSEDPGHHASDGITVPDPPAQATLDALGNELLQWFASLYYQPKGSDAWKPPSLEYEFACSTPVKGNEKVLSADEYFHGHLDWYAFDHDADTTSLGTVPDAPVDVEQFVTRSFIPAPVEFEGMPDTRWWALEDRKTNLGDIRPSTTDLAKLLFVEFGLVYANDWFLVPFRLPTGALARVEGMAVTNTFGERFWIEAAGKGSDQAWHRWSMFSLSVKGSAEVPADTSLFLPPAVAKMQEGAPLEEIQFIRDEVANMVWAVESIVPLVTGRGRSGKDSAHEMEQYHRRLIAEGGSVTPNDYKAAIHYAAMTTVPENWIPFIPVHVDGSNREVQLKRSRMLRTIEGDPLPPGKISPRTTLVREGLDGAAPEPYFVHEEEVARAGVQLTQSFQRTRWTGGKAYVWLGNRKQVGRGEGSSGLAFDTIVHVKTGSET